MLHIAPVPKTQETDIDMWKVMDHEKTWMIGWLYKLTSESKLNTFQCDSSQVSLTQEELIELQCFLEVINGNVEAR
jgi:hypothetical protein